MATAGAQIVVPQIFKAWERGFGRLPVDAIAVAEQHWSIATELFYSETQEAVHIVSGDLKNSGRSRTEIDGATVVGEVEYGGTMESEGFVDYALEEINRGGEHDYMGRGWESAEHAFNAALPMTWREVVGGWR